MPDMNHKCLCSKEAKNAYAIRRYISAFPVTSSWKKAVQCSLTMAEGSGDILLLL